ncbi:MAG: hypothetical protein WCD00_05115 [Desulfuromonadaceae bacterium]
MKSTGKLIIFVLTLLALATSAYAQSTREQLQQMVEQLQKTPNDNALREKIVNLATSIKPLPAIPEEAREPFVMGATILKRASGPAGAGKAVELFTQALNIAPWFADAYYNRAIARESAGEFEAAMDDLKLYLGFNLSAAERREAQDKIYSLKADAQLAYAKKAEQSKIVSAVEEKRQAQQAKLDVITNIKNVVNNRNYQQKNLGYNNNSWDGGVNQNELFGGGTFYMFSFDFHVPIYWKFFDERVELWGSSSYGQELLLRGESWGPKVTDMRWFQVNTLTLKNALQVWAYFDLRNGYLYSTLNGWVMRPINDSEFDPNKRYNYVLYKPVN